MNLNLSGKNALVCGSSQGIGKAAAFELAALGANVTLAARTETALQQLAKEINTDKGQQHDYLIADFNQPHQLQIVVEEFMAATGKVFHILINNSGGPPGGAITAATADDFLKAYNRHLICNQLLAQLLLPGMKSAGYGRIINIISTSVREPIPGLGVSNTTRWAVASWAKTWAGEVGQFGITVNNVLPGFTATKRLQEIIKSRASKQNVADEVVANNMMSTVPAGRFAEASEVGAAIAFLASPAAAYINGINLPVDGGRLKSL